MKLPFFKEKQIVKVSFFNAILVLVKALSGIITSKVVAYFLGPTGLALIGNFKNFTQSALSFTAEGYQNGTIRYVAESDGSDLNRRQVVATVFQLSGMFSILIGLILLGFSEQWSIYLFQVHSYAYIIKLIGFGLPFTSFNLLIIYILNGLEKYKKLVLVNSVLSIVNMLVAVLCIINFGLIGGFLGFILGPVIAFLLNLLALGNDRVILLSAFNFQLFSLKIISKMSSYLFMAIYSVIIVSVTILLIRNLIIDKLSIEQAGYWEAMNRISSFYLMFFTSMTSFYLLPRLSKNNSFNVFKREIKSFYNYIIPILIVCFVFIYFIRYPLLSIFLDDAFYPTANLFSWQLVGDFISVLAIALVKQFHAKLMVKEYVMCNGTLNVLYLLLSYLFIDIYGLVGVTKAYVVSYFVYFFMVLFFVNYTRKNYDKI